VTYVDDLSQLSGQLVEPPAEFAVSADVWTAVRDWPTQLADRGGQIHTVCGRCDQSIMVMAKDGQAYSYAELDQDGLTLAHLIQRHEWTREGPR